MTDLADAEPHRTWLLLLRTLGLALAASGFVVAIWQGTSDYPNGFVAFPVGVSLVLLTLSPDDEALAAVVHVWCAALVATTQLSHVMFLAPSSWRLATLGWAESFKQQAHIVWIRFGPAALTALGTSAVVIGLAAIASLIVFWPRARRACVGGDGTSHAWALVRGAHAAIAINVLTVRLYVIVFYPDAPLLFEFGPLFGFVVTPPLDVIALSWCEVLTATLWLCCAVATAPHRRAALQARIRGSGKTLL